MGLLDFFSMPMDATGSEFPIGYDEAGNPVRRTMLGHQYTAKPQASPDAVRQRAIGDQMAQGLLGSPLYSLQQAEIDAQRKRSEGALGGLLSGLWEGVKQGVEAPGRAAAGEPVTYGDAWASALDYGAIAAPAGKPAGALGGGGIRAYHGSPHDFDKFSMNKIGTGEGAQAYGHGLYFAENEGVARGYRDALSGSDPTTLHSALYNMDDVATHVKDQAFNYTSDPDSSRLMRYLDLADPNAAERLRTRETGKMYEVNINADPADFLDYDATWGQQSPANMERLKRVFADEIAKEPWLDISSLDMSAPRPSEVERLREAGVPGIKYRDAGSRGLDGADGTRNFVVFDENLIEIVRKYGIAGAAALTGMTVAEIEAGMGQAQAAPQGLLGVQ